MSNPEAQIEVQRVQGQIQLSLPPSGRDPLGEIVEIQFQNDLDELRGTVGLPAESGIAAVRPSPHSRTEHPETRRERNLDRGFFWGV